MAIAEGIQASGQAGVFGNAINPLQVYMQQNANKQKRPDDQLKYDREQRDTLISDLRKFNPDKVWDPFYQEVNEYVQNNVRDFANGALQKGAPVSAINPYLERRKGDANTLVSKINWLKSTYEQGAKGYDDDDYIDQDKALSEWNDVFFEGGKARKSYEIKDPDKRRQEIANNPDNYLIDKVVVDFMKTLPTKVTQQWSEYWGQLGQQYNVQETQTKLGFQYDDKGQVILDERTGQPKISMTDEVFTQSMQNKYLRNIVDKYVGVDQPKEAKREYLTKLLEGQDPRTIKNRPQFGFKLTKEDKWTRGGFSGRVNPDNVIERFDNNEAIVNGFRPDILANTYSPFEDQEVKYVDAKGKAIVKQSNGQYYDEAGNVAGKPSKIRVEFNAKANPYAIQGIMMDPNLSDEDKQTAMAESMKNTGTVTRDFDITNESGRRQAHEALNRILDEYLPKGDRYSEDYTKLVREKYENKKSIPGTGWTKGKTIPGWENK